MKRVFKGDVISTDNIPHADSKFFFPNQIHHSFHMEALDSHLFDPKFTMLLNKVKFRNETLQMIIQLMSPSGISDHQDMNLL